MFQDFSFLTHTHKTLHFNSLFSPFTLLPLYIYLSTTLHVIPYQIHTDKKQSHLRSIFRQHLPSYNQGMRACIFILNDNGNYNFNIKIRHYGFLDFVNDVIDCGCLEYVFYFIIKNKEKDIFYINFYSITFLQSFFFFNFSLLQLNNYNGYVCAIYNYYFL